MARIINKKLAGEILERVKSDQQMRRKFAAENIKWDKRTDKENTEWLKKIILKYGWPTISLVGKKASNGAWLLAQHADHSLRFQKKVLTILKDIYKKDKKEINSANIAYLTDRILIKENKPQIFGTQFRRNKKKEIEQ